MTQKKSFWFIVFGLILILMTLYLFVFPLEGIGWFGFPKWVYGFLIISGLYSFAIYHFSKSYWKEELNN